jgi:hypothetical protein
MNRLKALAARLAGRWICPPPCGAINPDFTGTCIRCGK